MQESEVDAHYVNYLNFSTNIIMWVRLVRHRCSEAEMVIALLLEIRCTMPMPNYTPPKRWSVVSFLESGDFLLNYVSSH